MSWSGEGATLRSPLEQVWRQFVPQGHDTALRNAFYNVAAAGFVVVAGAAAWNVYIIFQPFVRALLWAVLCGSAMHPAKTVIVDALQSWLSTIKESSSSLTLATLLLPLNMLDAISEMVAQYIVRHARSVVIVTVVLPVVFILIHYTPAFLTSVLYWILSSAFNAIRFVMAVATSNKYVVVSLVCCYITSLFIHWERELYRKWLSRLSVAVWLLAGAGMAGWLFPESATQPVFASFCSLLLIGLAVEVFEYMRNERQGDSTAGLVQSVVRVCRDEYQQSPPHRTTASNSVLASGSLESVQEEGDTTMRTDDSLQSDDANSATRVRGVTSLPDAKEEHPHSICTSNRPASLDADEPSVGVPTQITDTPVMSEQGETSARASVTQDRKSGTADEGESVSNTYIKGVLLACVLLELWRHHYLLALLPIALVYFVLKKTTSMCLSGGSLGSTALCWWMDVWGIVRGWADVRRDALMPPPVRGVHKVLCRSEACLLQVLSGCLDALVTSFLILAALCFIVSAGLFLAVQIQGESMQLVGVASQIINATVVSNPQFLAMLPDDIGDTLSNALDDAYIYGRDALTKWVRGLVGETDEHKANALEKQVLELWDRVYQAWLVSPPSNNGMAVHGPVVTSQAVADTFDNLIQGIANSPGLVSFSSLSQLLRDNVGTVWSVAEGVWALLMSNLSILLSLSTASASLLLGGSLSLLNAVINAVVFLTALFYVLSSTGHTYKPLAVLSNLAPGQMNSVGQALEEAINGVFTASLKMGVFYGLWTWLLHSIFATNIVYIPAVLGALFGAVPLLGTYWACLPGLLELWWRHDSPALALLLLVCQLAPLSCVDTAIYAEIKGGGHPYLTGLAVGGGIFCWGAEGAILGPLLLCCLLVATSLYASLIQPPPPGGRFGRLRRNLTITN